MPKNQRHTRVPALEQGSIPKGSKDPYMHLAKNQSVPDQGKFSNKLKMGRRGGSGAKRGNRG